MFSQKPKYAASGQPGHSAEATLAGIETAHMIRKGQIHANGLTAFQQFVALAA
jgi:putative transposase